MKVPWRIWRAVAGVSFFIASIDGTETFPPLSSYSTTESRSAHSVDREPLDRLGSIGDAEISSPSHRVHAGSHFDLHFSLHPSRQRLKFTLEPNQEIIAEGASVQYMSPDGELLRSEPIQRHAYRIYRGHVWRSDQSNHWTNVGWARIMVKRDGLVPLFEGAFTVGRDHHHVQLRSHYMATKHDLDPVPDEGGDEYMTVFRDSDIGLKTQRKHTELKRSEPLERSCRSDELQFNADPSQTVLKRDLASMGTTPINSLFGKRQIDTNGIPTGGNAGVVNLKQSIGKKDGCPTTRKVALIGVATDCTYTATFNSTQAAHENVIQQVASASSLYERTFNISLGLQNLTVMDATCPGSPPATAPWNQGCGGNLTIESRLNTFSTWRGQSNDSNAYWMLLTNCRTGSEVGLAWLGQLCNREVNGNGAEVVSGAAVVAKTSTEWQVIAHESGHTFGAVHDCDAQTCASQNSVNSQQCCPLNGDTCNAGSRYIMNPSTTENIHDFSPCSVGNICAALGRNSVKSECLSDNKGVTTITGNQCGNGIVEEGEDCDCGGEESCGDNNCCNAKTCKFKDGAVCDDSNEDCCRSCQFASAGTVCRPSTGECDPQETCPGTTALCPEDQSAPDGQGCGQGSDRLQCASGQCTSRNQQCKTLMGSYTAKNDTYACNSQDCSLSCASPEFGPGVCYQMQQNFLDGTTCGGGGKCQNVSINPVLNPWIWSFA